MMKLHALRRLLPYTQAMDAPVRRVRITRFGDYLQVGDQSVFVPAEATYKDINKPIREINIKGAGFTVGSIDKERPEELSDADQQTKDIIKRFYEDWQRVHPANVSPRLVY